MERTAGRGKSHGPGKPSEGRIATSRDPGKEPRIKAEPFSSGCGAGADARDRRRDSLRRPRGAALSLERTAAKTGVFAEKHRTHGAGKGNRTVHRAEPRAAWAPRSHGRGWTARAANRNPPLSFGPAPHTAPPLTRPLPPRGRLAPPLSHPAPHQAPPRSRLAPPLARPAPPPQARAAAGLPEVRPEWAPQAEVSAQAGRAGPRSPGVGPGAARVRAGSAGPGEGGGVGGPSPCAGSARGDAASAGEGRRACACTPGGVTPVPRPGSRPGACGPLWTLQPRVWTGTEDGPRPPVFPQRLGLNLGPRESRRAEAESPLGAVGVGRGGGEHSVAPPGAL